MPTSVLCRPCSRGTPMPRSVASDIAAMTSAARTRPSRASEAPGRSRPLSTDPSVAVRVPPQARPTMPPPLTRSGTQAPGFGHASPLGGARPPDAGLVPFSIRASFTGHDSRNAKQPRSRFPPCLGSYANPSALGSISVVLMGSIPVRLRYQGLTSAPYPTTIRGSVDPRLDLGEKALGVIPEIFQAPLRAEVVRRPLVVVGTGRILWIHFHPTDGIHLHGNLLSSDDALSELRQFQQQRVDDDQHA